MSVGAGGGDRGGEREGCGKGRTDSSLIDCRRTLSISCSFCRAAFQLSMIWSSALLALLLLMGFCGRESEARRVRTEFGERGRFIEKHARSRHMTNQVLVADVFVDDGCRSERGDASNRPLGDRPDAHSLRARSGSESRRVRQQRRKTGGADSP